MGLKMNIAKTKVMVVDNTPININNVLIENVQGYVYLGQHYSLKEKNQDKEIQRRIMAGWAAYAKHRDIFKSNLAICLKRQVYNSCVLPAMTYGAETWTLTKQAQNKLAAAQTKMERSMLNITYKDRKTNIWVRERTKVIDIINTVRKMKWSWAGHINRLKDDRWTSRVTSWRPYDKKRRQGRPAKRWRDDLDKYWSDTIWQRKAQDRVVWRQHAEAFAQPRDTTAAWWWWWWNFIHHPHRPSNAPQSALHIWVIPLKAGRYCDMEIENIKLNISYFLYCRWNISTDT